MKQRSNIYNYYTMTKIKLVLALRHVKTIHNILLEVFQCKIVTLERRSFVVKRYM